MKYRLDRYGNQISQLGYGCMRFSKKGNVIDYEKAEKEVLLAIEKGVNYLIPLIFTLAMRNVSDGFWMKTSAVTGSILPLSFRSMSCAPLRQLIKLLASSCLVSAQTILIIT